MSCLLYLHEVELKTRLQVTVMPQEVTQQLAGHRGTEEVRHPGTEARVGRGINGGIFVNRMDAARGVGHDGHPLILQRPARLVVGYLHELEPMDIHAWFEAFVGGQWYVFDPSVPNTDAARIAIARGRDATDVAIYNQYGPLLLPSSMQVTVEVK